MEMFVGIIEVGLVEGLVALPTTVTSVTYPEQMKTLDPLWIPCLLPLSVIQYDKVIVKCTVVEIAVVAWILIYSVIVL